ncbi:MAG: hypothetical protein QME45_05905 [Clostridiales bacterium]|nr:hypothetical protein [Clostridiales bacterium]HBM81908.1 hypothetical protein [Clostridiaceae bacterium]
MWTVIYVARCRQGAKELKNMLANQGVFVKTRQISRNKNNDGLHEILVPETEVEDACIILEQLKKDY